MSHLDFLRQGSEVHKVRPRGVNTFMISPADESDGCWLSFQMLVADAAANSFEGYEVMPHKTFTRSLRDWSGPVYDCAAIMLQD
jgi:hypothetical protein